MSPTDVVHGMLTALFGAATIHALRHTVLPRNSGWRSWGDHFLHTAMALAMAVMPWHLSGGQSLPGQTAFFAAAALWFPLTAIADRQSSGLTGAARRSPYAVGMAAMAWMTVRHGDFLDAQTGELITGALALYLLAYALRSLTQDMPTLRGAWGTNAVSTGISGPCTRFWHGSTAMGTAVMLLIHH